MRNYDARMTGEVDRHFQGQRRTPSVLRKIRSVIAAVVVLFAICSGTVLTLRATPQQNASGSERVSHAPAITAKPERVTLFNGSGSTEIEWDTGTGSMGFVFLTEDGGKPVAFASGSRGNQNRSVDRKPSLRLRTLWRRPAADVARESRCFWSGQDVSSQQTLSWQAVARWPLIIGLAAILYWAVYLSSTGPVRTTFPTEPTTSLRRLHVARNLLLGVAAFICVDGASFFIADCMSRSWPQVLTRDVSRKLRKPKRSALHQV